jgi:hypothetical protein
MNIDIVTIGGRDGHPNVYRERPPIDYSIRFTGFLVKNYQAIYGGDLISFGAKKVYSKSKPEDLTYTKNEWRVGYGCCPWTKDNSKDVNGWIVTDPRHRGPGDLLSELINEYINNNSFTCGGGSWIYEDLYLTVDVWKK